MLEQVSDVEEIKDVEESTSDDEEQDHCVFHEIDDESEIERGVRQPSRQRHAPRPSSGGNATTSPHASPVQELVPTPCVWSRSQHLTSTKKSW